MNRLVLLAALFSSTYATLTLSSVPVAPAITEHRHPYGNGNPHWPLVAHVQTIPPFYLPPNFHSNYPSLHLDAPGANPIAAFPNPLTGTTLTRPFFVKHSHSATANPKPPSTSTSAHSQPQPGYGPTNVPFDYPYTPYYRPGPHYPQYHYVSPYGHANQYGHQYPLIRSFSHGPTVPGVHQAASQIPEIHNMPATSPETPLISLNQESHTIKEVTDNAKFLETPALSEIVKPIIPKFTDVPENIPTIPTVTKIAEVISLSSDIVRISGKRDIPEPPLFPIGSLISSDIRPTPEMERIVEAESRTENETHISLFQDIFQSDPTNSDQLSTTAAPMDRKSTVAPTPEVTTQQPELSSQPIVSLEVTVPSHPVLLPIQSAFTCVDRPYGYYADLDDCTVFHICLVVPPIHSFSLVEFQRSTFRCGPGTVFSQLKRTCVHDTGEETCANAAINYSINDDFGIIPEFLPAELIEAQTNTFPALEPLNQRIKDGLKNPNSPFRQFVALLPKLNNAQPDAQPIKSKTTGDVQEVSISDTQ